MSIIHVSEDLPALVGRPIPRLRRLYPFDHLARRVELGGWDYSRWGNPPLRLEGRGRQGEPLLGPHVPITPELHVHYAEAVAVGAGHGESARRGPRTAGGCPRRDGAGDAGRCDGAIVARAARPTGRRGGEHGQGTGARPTRRSAHGGERGVTGGEVDGPPIGQGTIWVRSPDPRAPAIVVEVTISGRGGRGE